MGVMSMELNDIIQKSLAEKSYWINTDREADYDIIAVGLHAGS